jgi:S1-C subfamily serine protease
MPADDDEASGPPPHPLDRVWFHPSELGAPVAALRPQPAAPRVWVVAALALVVGILGTLGVVSVVGTFTDGSAPTNRLERTVATPVDTERIETLVQTTGRSITRISVVPAGGVEPVAMGSGVVIGAGQVLTAAHLLADQGAVSVVSVGGQVTPAEVLGIDPETDLALLAVDDVELATAQLAIGTGSTLRVGKSVTALAAGSGNRPVVGVGVISASNQFATLPTGVRGSAMIVTSAAANAAVAGGALLDTERGGVVGILTGNGYAVPIDVARDVAAQIKATGQAVHGWLGVVGDEALDRQGGGVRVQAVVPGSPATSPIDLLGTPALLPGDVILAVGDVDVTSEEDLVAAVRRLRPQDPVALTIVRGDKARTVQVPALGASQALSADLAIVA